MEERFRLILVVAIILVVVIAFIIVGYQFDWTGFNVYTVTVKSNAPSGTTLPTNITVYLPSKTLYDWLQLLIIPFVIAIAGYVINLTISRGEQKATEQRDKTERDIALDRQYEATLKDYFDKMSELLLHQNLRNSSKGDEVRNIAVIWTALALATLDASRKYSVVVFLIISKLIEVDNNIVNLSGGILDKVDLSDMKLIGLNFEGADLIEVNFTNAVLRKANLSHANLTNANLRGARVTKEQLSKAKSLSGATMPDGSILP